MAEGKSFDEAYGSLMGVFMVGAIFQSMFSFIPPRFLRRIFPSWLAGLGVFLIGVSLVGVGVQSWGGGGDCAGNLTAACSQVGDSKLPFGSPEYIGLGFLVMSTNVLVELFGSPFMRSCSVAIALLFGYFIASVTADRNGDSYVELSPVKAADPIVFLWVKRFPIGFYTPALLPTRIAYVVSTIETNGDTTGTFAETQLLIEFYDKQCSFLTQSALACFSQPLPRPPVTFPIHLKPARNLMRLFREGYWVTLSIHSSQLLVWSCPALLFLRILESFP